MTKLAEEPPSQADLDAAFEQADEDRSGGIDEAEFLKLYSAVKRGDVKGVGLQSKVRAFFEDNGIEADVEATLATWAGKEEALLQRMEDHLSRTGNGNGTGTGTTGTGTGTTTTGTTVTVFSKSHRLETHHRRSYTKR